MSIDQVNYPNYITPVFYSGAAVLSAHCSYAIGDWLGKKLRSWTGFTLLSIVPRSISYGLYELNEQTIGKVTEFVEKRSPFLGKVIVAPIIEELAFRGTQVAVSRYLIPYFLSDSYPKLSATTAIALSSLVFSYSHGSGQPGRLMALFAIGVSLGITAQNLDLKTAILTHGLFNLTIDFFQS